MSAYLQAAPLPPSQPWGAVAGWQLLPASMLDMMVLQAQLLQQLQSPYGYASKKRGAGVWNRCHRLRLGASV